MAKVPDLAGLGFLPVSTAHAGLGSFVDDDGLVAGLASFVSTSVGAPGPTVGGVLTWLDLTEGPMPPAVVPNNGAPPVALPAGVWGQEEGGDTPRSPGGDLLPGSSNGLATVPASFLGFAKSIGPCTKPGCDGTPRVVDATMPNPAFPTYGGVNGGYEVVMAEGFAHVDVLTAEDDTNNPIPAALLDFLTRNAQ